MRVSRYPVRSTRFAVLMLAALATLSAAADDAAKSRIPEGAVAFKGHRYLLVDQPEELSWTRGRTQCAAWGGTLVVVNDREEADFIAGLCDGRYMFLGASDMNQEGVWTWVDGTAWEFTHWMDGQPNDYSGSEDYLATYDGGEWVDVDHDGSDFWMPTGFICEWSE